MKNSYEHKETSGTLENYEDEERKDNYAHSMQIVESEDTFPTKEDISSIETHERVKKI